MNGEALSPEMVSRFNGLMRHLKSNTDWDEQQKQVMVSNVEALVPEEYEMILQGEFERRCSFGDRMNTELMSSAKWVRTLRECGCIVPFDSDKRGLGCMPLASADMIFLKVMHDCDHGGKRLTYDLFCKALYLVSLAARPDLPSEAAFSELLSRIVEAAPEDPNRTEQGPDLMMDPNVINMLDAFKPALYTVFNAFCNRQLANPANARPGSGSIRLSERTFWKHTQETSLSSMGSFGRSALYGKGSREHSLNGSIDPSERSRGSAKVGDATCEPTPFDEDRTPVAAAAVSPAHSPRSAAAVAGPSEAVEKLDREGGGQEVPPLSPAARERLCGKAEARQLPTAQNAEADAGGGYAETSRRLDVVEPIYEDRIPTSLGGGAMIPQLPVGSLMLGMSMNASSCSGFTGTSQDPYQYANGQPVIRNRRRYMSVDQMLLLCKEFKIVPDFISRLEAVQIFKKAQCAGSHTSVGSSRYGYLNYEAFIDAAGQLALLAYGRSPFSEEYPEPQDKIQAFFLNVLPMTGHEARERFLYGCSGRGR
jgi:hypothetical protein